MTVYKDIDEVIEQLERIKEALIITSSAVLAISSEEEKIEIANQLNRLAKLL